MAVKLELDSPKSLKETRILLVINHYATKLRFPTGEKVRPSDWNKEKSEVRKTNPEYIEMNQRLAAQLAATKQAVTSLIREKEPITRESVRQKTNGMLEGRHGISMIDYLSKIIKQMETTERVKKDGKPYRPRTIQEYIDLRSVWNRFDEKIAVGRIDTSTVNKLLASLGDVSQNYRAKLTTQIKTVLKWAKGDKIPTLDITIQSATELTEKIILNESELNKLAALKLDGIDKTIRDLFLIGCYTGLRISDLQRFTPDNFSTEGDRTYMTITTQKTSQKTIIPIKPSIVDILNENKYSFHKHTKATFNTHIKQVCRLAGIITEVKTGITIGGQRKEQTVQKWEVVSSHTMRRSFATNLYLAGVDTTTIRKLTGHKTESSFFRYIRVSQEENAKKAAELAFFQ